MANRSIRRIPTDEEISIAFRRLQGSTWSTVLARLVVYGLRPHEAFLGQLADDGLFIVPDHTKTGERFVPPFDKRPAWLKAAAGQLPKVNARANREYGSRTWSAFKRKDVPFNPYDLRHRWVVLTEEAGIPPAVASTWAGHSPRTRYAIYTRTLDQRRALAYARKHGYVVSHVVSSQPTH